MSPRVAVVVSTSSTEAAFLKSLVEQATKFASTIVIAVGDCRFGGDYAPEPRDWLQQVLRGAVMPQEGVRVASFSVSPDTHNPLSLRPGAFWHNVSRIVGTREALNTLGAADWVLYLDGDEIPDGDACQAFFSSEAWAARHPDRVHRLVNHWYFMDPCFQSTQNENSAILVPVGMLQKGDDETLLNAFMRDYERDELYAMVPGDHAIYGLDGKPLIHHFSWARTKQDILRKVKSWGHSADRDWEDLIEEHWDKPFETDFVHGYRYVKVPDRFGIKDAQQQCLALLTAQPSLAASR